MGAAKMNTRPYVATDGVDSIAARQMEIVAYSNSSNPVSTVTRQIHFIVCHHVYTKHDAFSAKVPAIVQTIELYSEKVDQFSGELMISWYVLIRLFTISSLLCRFCATIRDCWPIR